MTDYVHRISDEESARIARFLRWLAIGVALFVVLVVALFMTAGSWLRLISPASERQFVEPYIEWSREHLLAAGDPLVQSYVESVAADLYTLLDPDREQRLRVHVVKGDTLNAFATLGGYVFVFDGLVRAAGGENELAMVLGHEIAHVHHRDPLTSAGRGLLIELALSALSGNGVDPQNLSLGTDLMLNRYSREQELAADELAVVLLQEKYGHTGGATRLFEIIANEQSSADVPEFLATHPDIDARLQQIRALAAANGWPEQGSLPYPRHVQEAL